MIGFEPLKNTNSNQEKIKNRNRSKQLINFDSKTPNYAKKI